MEAGCGPNYLTGLKRWLNKASTQGTDQYAGGYDVEIAKRVAKQLGKN